ncbi:MAG: DUF1848 domain-containing protein [Bacteroidales bacterium]|nr:DUF1848 domain-containing protein [Bacteroidales bacterium]
MILNTGGRTDTVQYYSEWLLRRFREGFVLSRNPVARNVVTRFRLSPDVVDIVVFCSKNYAPILPRLHEIASRFRCYYHYTITAYGADIEPRVPSIGESVETLRALSLMVGRERVAWRYDPVMIYGSYTVERHLETFEWLASRLAPYVDRCIFSFVQMYQKLKVNMPDLQLVPLHEQLRMAEGMGRIARKHGLHLQSCHSDPGFMSYGISREGCMTAAIFEQSLGLHFAPREARPNGNRPGCLCMETRGLGDYNTCPNGCRYCYANYDHEQALLNYRQHDPDSPLLLGALRPDDIVKDAVQRSFLSNELFLF